MPSYRNRRGATYHLPEFGPPVRWVAFVDPLGGPHDDPVAMYFECDAENLCMRAMHVHGDGRVLLACPGGPDGDHLPDVPVPPLDEIDEDPGESREMNRAEFEALWSALFRLPA